MSIRDWPNPEIRATDRGARLVLAPDLVVLVPPIRLPAASIAELGRQWREVTEGVRLIVLGEPVMVFDVRMDEDVAAMLPELRALVERTLDRIGS